MRNFWIWISQILVEAGLLSIAAYTFFHGGSTGLIVGGVFAIWLVYRLLHNPIYRYRRIFYMTSTASIAAFGIGQVASIGFEKLAISGVFVCDTDCTIHLKNFLIEFGAVSPGQAVIIGLILLFSCVGDLCLNANLLGLFTFGNVGKFKTHFGRDCIVQPMPSSGQDQNTVYEITGTLTIENRTDMAIDMTEIEVASGGFLAHWDTVQLLQSTDYADLPVTGKIAPGTSERFTIKAELTRSCYAWLMRNAGGWRLAANLWRLLAFRTVTVRLKADQDWVRKISGQFFTRMQ